MSVAENIYKLTSEIPKNVSLVAVSKTQSSEKILEAYNIGQRIFGENKVQELITKYELLPKDIKWHFIGHLQTNKVKFISNFVDLIHSVDSLKLLQTINKEAEKNNRVISCLFEMYIAEEETKFGLNYEELLEIVYSKDFLELKNIKICGLMGMASFTNNTTQITKEFQYLSECFNKIKLLNIFENTDFKELSMGMSSDYSISISCGSTLIRVGSTIFGIR